MDVDFCPKCHKAGLRYEIKHIPPWMPDNRTAEEKTESSRGLSNNEKWCPRCKEWVKPTSRNVMVK